jgi:hypothetical protein
MMHNDIYNEGTVNESISKFNIHLVCCRDRLLLSLPITPAHTYPDWFEQEQGFDTREIAAIKLVVVSILP